MYIRVKVTAGAKKETCIERKGVIVVSVREKAERNEANRRVTEIIAARYGVPVRSLRLVSGQHSSAKKFELVVR